MSTHNLRFKQKYEKIRFFLIGKFSVFGGEIFYIHVHVLEYLNRRVFVMKSKHFR